MKAVTQKELAQILLDTQLVKGMPLFASVLQLTKPQVNKKDRVTKEANPYTEILKFSKVSILLNSDYNRAVEKQLEKEEKDPTEHKKGKNTMVLTFGENNQFIGMYGGNFVLQYRPNDNVFPKSKYLADGKLIDKSKLVNLLPPPQKPTNQGTEKVISWRKLYLSNVKKLAFNGEIYKVID
jgi:hypothetical protein